MIHSFYPTRLVHSIAVGSFLFVVSAGVAHATTPPLSGSVPADLVQTVHDHLYRATQSAQGLRTQAYTGNWRIPVMLVSFADDSLRYSASDFERLLFDTTHAIPTGSVAEYWNSVSQGRVRLRGRVVSSVRLPLTQSDYAAYTYGLEGGFTPRNIAGYVKAMLALSKSFPARTHKARRLTKSERIFERRLSWLLRPIVRSRKTKAQTPTSFGSR